MRQLDSTGEGKSALLKSTHAVDVKQNLQPTHPLEEKSFGSNIFCVVFGVFSVIFEKSDMYFVCTLYVLCMYFICTFQNYIQSTYVHM